MWGCFIKGYVGASVGSTRLRTVFPVTRLRPFLPVARIWLKQRQNKYKCTKEVGSAS